MRRREFISLLGGAATWPLAAHAQQTVMPTVGIMLAGSLEALRRAIAGIHEGLKESGFVEGQNVAVEYRFAEGHFDRFAVFASELVRRQVTVLVVSSANGAQAAKQATTTIPIVFSIGGDPVESGLVASLNRPESNITGVYQFTAGLEAKRLGLLHEMAPKATRIAVLINPNYSESEAQLRDVQQAASSLGAQLVIARANAENDFDAAFATFSREGTGALLVCASPFFNTRREQLVVLAARHALPGMYEWRDFAANGGLMSYGTSLREAYRQAGASGTLRRIRCNAQIRELSEVQRTCHELVGPIGPALMTHLGHERASFAVMHNAAFPTTIW